MFSATTILPSGAACAWSITTARSTRDRFETYRRRFSPYCSVASLYLWAVSGGALPEMKDYRPKKKDGKA